MDSLNTTEVITAMAARGYKLAETYPDGCTLSSSNEAPVNFGPGAMRFVEDAELTSAARIGIRKSFFGFRLVPNTIYIDPAQDQVVYYVPTVPLSVESTVISAGNFVNKLEARAFFKNSGLLTINEVCGKPLPTHPTNDRAHRLVHGALRKMGLESPLSAGPTA
jgi:hypothetical protein